MLTIGKLGSSESQLAYCERQVAAGAEDYYAGRGESPGVWIGGGLKALDVPVGSRVSREAFLDLMEGRHPVDGSQLRRVTRALTVAAVDLTFSAPKSVSVRARSVAQPILGRQLSSGATGAAGHPGWLRGDCDRARALGLPWLSLRGLLAVVPLAVVGLGLGMLFVPTSRAALNAMPAALHGRTSAALSVGRLLGAGVAGLALQTDGPDARTVRRAMLVASALCRTFGVAAARALGRCPLSAATEPRDETRTVTIGQAADHRGCHLPVVRGTVQLMTTSTITKPGNVEDDALIDAILGAGRALVAVAVRSLHEVGDDVTVAQHRALVELAGRGPQRVADLALVLSVDRSSATRMCDRLVRKRLVRRRRLDSDRRGVRVALTPHGQALVTAVRIRRQQEVSRIVGRLRPQDRRAVLYGLRAFAAADDAPDPDWSSGWRSPANASATAVGGAADGADGR